MDIIDSLALANLKRCPRCNQLDLSIINLFSAREFDERGFIDLFCPHCMINIEKDRYGRTNKIIDFSSKKTNIFLPSPKGKPLKAFLLKRSDLYE